MKYKVGDKVKLVAWERALHAYPFRQTIWRDAADVEFEITAIDENDTCFTYYIRGQGFELWASEFDIYLIEGNPIGKTFDYGFSTWKIADILHLNEDWYVCKSLDENAAMTYKKSMVDDFLQAKKAKYNVGDRVVIRPMVVRAITNGFHETIKGVWIGKISSCEVKNGEIVYTVDFGKCGVDLEVEEANIMGLFESFDTDELINTFVTKDDEVERLRERMNFFMYYIGFLEGDKKITPLRFPKACEYAREYTFGDWISVNRFIHDKHLNLKKKG